MLGGAHSKRLNRMEIREVWLVSQDTNCLLPPPVRTPVPSHRCAEQGAQGAEPDTGMGSGVPGSRRIQLPGWPSAHCKLSPQQTRQNPEKQSSSEPDNRIISEQPQKYTRVPPKAHCTSDHSPPTSGPRRSAARPVPRLPHSLHRRAPRPTHAFQREPPRPCPLPAAFHRCGEVTATATRVFHFKEHPW